MIFEVVKEPNDELLQGLNKLIHQIKASSTGMASNLITRLLSSDAVRVFIAREANNDIVGMLSLVVYPTPTGIHARIEDVVVDEHYRRNGIATELVNRALDAARERGADGVALTSNSRRQAANKLYARVGFLPWDTNVYYYKFKRG